MKKVLHLYLAITFIFLTAFSCGKDDEPQPPQQDQLPPITQTGAYTFGCLVNGEVWLPKHYSNSIVNPPVVLQASWGWNGGIFQIIATQWRKDDNSDRASFELYVKASLADTVFFEQDIPGNNGYYSFSPSKGIDFEYLSIKDKSSWIHFSRFDTINRIASGTFSIDLLNMDDDQDTGRIREGRFDVPF